MGAGVVADAVGSRDRRLGRRRHALGHRGLRHPRASLLQRWKDLIEAVGRVIVRVFGDANDKGDDIVETLTQDHPPLRSLAGEEPGRHQASSSRTPETFANDFLTRSTMVDEMGGLIDGRCIAEFWTSSADKPPGLAEAARHRPSTIGDAGQPSTGSRCARPDDVCAYRLAQPRRDLVRRRPVAGTGDIVPAMLEPGEFVIRRSVAQAIGAGRLSALNAGRFDAALVGGGGGVHIENINLPPAPGHDQLGDPRHQAALLAAELRRRGGRAHRMSPFSRSPRRPRPGRHPPLARHARPQ